MAGIADKIVWSHFSIDGGRNYNSGWQVRSPLILLGNANRVINALGIPSSSINLENRTIDNRHAVDIVRAVVRRQDSVLQNELGFKVLTPGQNAALRERAGYITRSDENALAILEQQRGLDPGSTSDMRKASQLIAKDAPDDLTLGQLKDQRMLWSRHMPSVLVIGMNAEVVFAVTPHENPDAVEYDAGDFKGGFNVLTQRGDHYEVNANTRYATLVRGDGKTEDAHPGHAFNLAFMESGLFGWRIRMVDYRRETAYAGAGFSNCITFAARNFANWLTNQGLDMGQTFTEGITMEYERLNNESGGQEAVNMLGGPGVRLVNPAGVYGGIIKQALTYDYAPQFADDITMALYDRVSGLDRGDINNGWMFQCEDPYKRFDAFYNMMFDHAYDYTIQPLLDASAEGKPWDTQMLKYGFRGHACDRQMSHSGYFGMDGYSGQQRFLMGVNQFHEFVRSGYSSPEEYSGDAGFVLGEGGLGGLIALMTTNDQTKQAWMNDMPLATPDMLAAAATPGAHLTCRIPVGMQTRTFGYTDGWNQLHDNGGENIAKRPFIIVTAD